MPWHPQHLVEYCQRTLIAASVTYTDRGLSAHIRVAEEFNQSTDRARRIQACQQVNGFSAGPGASGGKGSFKRVDPGIDEHLVAARFLTIAKIAQPLQRTLLRLSIVTGQALVERLPTQVVAELKQCSRDIEPDIPAAVRQHCPQRRNQQS